MMCRLEIIKETLNTCGNLLTTYIELHLTESYIRESAREFIFCDITEQEVYQLWSLLSPNTASGLDGFQQNLLNWPPLTLLNL